jgi:hypothetical protein
MEGCVGHLDQEFLKDIGFFDEPSESHMILPGEFFRRCDFLLDEKSGDISLMNYIMN